MVPYAQLVSPDGGFTEIKVNVEMKEGGRISV